ncbi:MAG: hypothetical protein L3J39_15700 [Verrucomicrobiales bacterium]|nr:hypothetical protein [Verrucomicrobiales bacterium]
MKTSKSIPSLRALSSVGLVWVLTLSFISSQTSDFTSRDQVKAFHHPQTDLILPREIAGFQVEEISRYGKSGFEGDDISIRYLSPNHKVDVYLYQRDDKLLENDENHQAIIGQIRETQQVIQQLATKKKIYSNVKIGDQAQVYTFGDGITMIEAKMSYRQQVANNDIFDNNDLESSVAVAIYAHYFIKIRHTFVTPKDEKSLALRQQKQQQFRESLCQLIADTEIRPDIIKALKTFQSQPQDPDSIGAIAAYAEESELVHISIQAEYMPYLEQENFKGSEILLVAHMAGNINAQLKNMTFTSHDLEGLQQMLKTYQLLKKSNAVTTNATLDRWSQLKPTQLTKLMEQLNQKK